MENLGETVCSSGTGSFPVVHVRNPILWPNRTTCQAIRLRVVRRLSLHRLNVTPQGLAPLGARDAHGPGDRSSATFGTRHQTDTMSPLLTWNHYGTGWKGSLQSFIIAYGAPPQIFATSGFLPTASVHGRDVTLLGIGKRRCSPTTVVNVCPYTTVIVGIPPTDGARILYDNMQRVPFFRRPPGPAPGTGTTWGSGSPYPRTVPCHRTPISCSQGFGQHQYSTSYKSLGGVPCSQTGEPTQFKASIATWYFLIPHSNNLVRSVALVAKTLGNSANS